MGINYNQAISQADKMLDLSRALNSEIFKMEDLLSRIKREWYGPASDAFQQELVRLIANLKTTERKICEVSDKVREHANVRK